MLTVAQALDLAMNYLDKIEVKGRENVFNLYKAQDALAAIKIALAEQNKQKEVLEKKDGE